MWQQQHPIPRHKQLQQQTTRSRHKRQQRQQHQRQASSRGEQLQQQQQARRKSEQQLQQQQARRRTDRRRGSLGPAQPRLLSCARFTALSVPRNTRCCGACLKCMLRHQVRSFGWS